MQSRDAVVALRHGDCFQGVQGVQHLALDSTWVAKDPCFTSCTNRVQLDKCRACSAAGFARLTSTHAERHVTLLKLYFSS